MSFRTEPLLQCIPDCDEYINHTLGYPTHGQYKPFFFNQHRCPLNIEGMYADESLFIICGGPSLNSINFDLLRTPGVMLMTINNSVVSLLNRRITPQFSLFCDQPDCFISEMLLNPAIQKFTPFNNLGKPLWSNRKWKPLDMVLKDCSNVAYFFRAEKFLAERWFKEYVVTWGSHKKKGEDCRSTLLAAIKVSFILGFRKVYLLGVDFNMKKEGSYAFNEGRDDHMVKTNNRNYQLLSKKYLPWIKKEGEKLNFYIYNTNNNSNLKLFEYVSLEEAVAKSTEACSPTDVIETKGLYNISYDDKKKLTRQQAINKVSGELPKKED